MVVAERLVVLLPPSQGKAPGGRRPSARSTFESALASPRREVREALGAFVARATPAQLEATFGARGPLLERALEGTREILAGSAAALPAWRRYQGVVWTHLAPDTLTPSQRRRILVPSGLYGLLAGDDHIGDYRLRMNARLDPLPSLARFWRSEVTAALLTHAAPATVVSFLPQEHTASVDMVRLAQSRSVIDVQFVTADQARAVGHDAKAVKGDLARAVLREGLAALSVPSRSGWRVERRGHVVVVIAPATRSENVAS
jgi:cytoplasmic iron level regulating protein YaaA (DUF328/UPF0246 family)